MFKRILLALALTASVGGAVVACTTPAASTNPSVVTPSTMMSSEGPVPSEMSPGASEMTSASPS